MSAVDEAREALRKHRLDITARLGDADELLDALIAAVRAETWKDGFVAGVMQMTTWSEDSARLEAARQYDRRAGAEAVIVDEAREALDAAREAVLSGVTDDRVRFRVALFEAAVRAEYESLEKASQAVVIARSRGTFDDAINDLAQARAALEQKP